jgi:hypothetical protein
MNRIMNNYSDVKRSYPFIYLGILMHYQKSNNKDREMIEERIEKSCAVGKVHTYRWEVD